MREKKQRAKCADSRGSKICFYGNKTLRVFSAIKTILPAFRRWTTQRASQFASLLSEGGEHRRPL